MGRAKVLVIGLLAVLAASALAASSAWGLGLAIGGESEGAVYPTPPGATTLEGREFIPELSFTVHGKRVKCNPEELPGPLTIIVESNGQPVDKVSFNPEGELENAGGACEGAGFEGAFELRNTPWLLTASVRGIAHLEAEGFNGSPAIELRGGSVGEAEHSCIYERSQLTGRNSASPPVPEALEAEAFSFDFPASAANRMPLNAAKSKGPCPATVTPALSARDFHFGFEGEGRGVFEELVPEVVGVSPSTGPSAGGTQVTVTGAGFLSFIGGRTTAAFEFGSAPASAVNCSSAKLCTLHTPAHAPGTVTVRATIGGQSSPVTAEGDKYTFLPPPPAVTRVHPRQGPAAGGTAVEISGEHLSGTTAVKFGSANASSYTENSDKSITAVSPRGTGTVHVSVTTGGGPSRETASDTFRYLAG